MNHLQSFTVAGSNTVIFTTPTSIFLYDMVFRACQKKNPKAIQTAVKMINNMNINLLNYVNHNAFHAICNSSSIHWDVQTLFYYIPALVIKCDINARDVTGQTPLMKACMYNQSAALIISLLENGADPNIRDNRKQTALHIFANCPLVNADTAQITRQLMIKIKNHLTQDIDGFTPMDLTLKSGNSVIREEIEKTYRIRVQQVAYPTLSAPQPSTSNQPLQGRLNPLSSTTTTTTTPTSMITDSEDDSEQDEYEGHMPQPLNLTHLLMDAETEEAQYRDFSPPAPL
jgi:hypothetical protein